MSTNYQPQIVPWAASLPSPSDVNREALDAIAKSPSELLLCDLNIEEKGDGYKVVRAMREVNPRCATVVLAAYPAVESAVEGIHPSIDDYVVKPADANALAALIAQRIAGKQPRARILSVSYDEVLLRTRQMLLESKGYEVISAAGLEASLTECGRGDFFLRNRDGPGPEKGLTPSCWNWRFS